MGHSCGDLTGPLLYKIMKGLVEATLGTKSRHSRTGSGVEMRR